MPFAAEMVAAMYDASLDAFRSNYWSFSPWSSRYNTHYWDGNAAFTYVGSSIFQRYWNSLPGYRSHSYDNLNYFGWHAWDDYGGYYYRNEGYGMDDWDGEGGEEYDMMFEDEAAGDGPPPPPSPKSAGRTRANSQTVALGGAKLDDSENDAITGSKVPQDNTKVDKGKEGEGKSLGNVKVRTNLNETAFFFPKMNTNEMGEVILSFTVPEALTRWKMMGLAHTQDLKTGQISKETVTQKELMVMPNTPRFFRENDKMTFTAKVSNLAEKDLSGTAELELLDAFTLKPVDANFQKSLPPAEIRSEKGDNLPGWPGTSRSLKMCRRLLCG